jgi:hypothetical protein
MSLLLPLDDNGNPIAILGFDYRGTQRVAVTTESIRNAEPIPNDIEVVTVVATGPCRFEVGDGSVEADPATSPFLYPGHYVDIPLRRGERYLAFVAEGEPCAAYVIGRV